MTASPGSLHRNYLHVPDWDAGQKPGFVGQPSSPVELGVNEINPVHGRAGVQKYVSTWANTTSPKYVFAQT